MEIDSLLLSIGLDGKQLSAGAAEALAVFAKLQAAAKKDADNVETSAKKAQDAEIKRLRETEGAARKSADQISKVRNQVIGLLAAFTAGKGLKDFVESQTASAVALQRNSTLLGENVKDLSAWQQVAQRTGGSAEAITGTMRGLNGAIQEYQLTGQSAVIPYLNSLHINLRKANGELKTSSDLILELGKNSELHSYGDVRGGAILKSLGIDDATALLILKNGDALSKLVEDQKKFATTQKQSEDFSKIFTGFEDIGIISSSLGRTVLDQLAPAILFVLDKVKQFLTYLSEHTKVLDLIVGGIAVLAGAASIAVISLAGAITGTLVGGAFTALVSGFAAVTGAAAPFLAVLAAILAVGYGVSKALSAIDPSDKLGTWIDQHVPGASFLDNAASKFGIGQSYDQQGVKAAPYTSDVTSDIKTFEHFGHSHDEAVGIVANLYRESGGRANATGDNGQAYGLFQWHPPRQQEFEKVVGTNIRESTRDQQLAFIEYELQNHPEYGGGAIKGKDAASVAGLVSRLDLRPGAADKEASVRAAIANSFLKDGAQQVPHSWQITASGVTRSGGATSTSEVNIGTQIIQTQATDAAGIAKDIGPAMRANSLATQANQGQL